MELGGAFQYIAYYARRASRARNRCRDTRTWRVPQLPHLSGPRQGRYHPSHYPGQRQGVVLRLSEPPSPDVSQYFKIDRRQISDNGRGLAFIVEGGPSYHLEG